MHRPFIKIDSNIYWLGRLVKNRRWDVIIRNKLKQDKLYPNHELLKALIDKNLEKAIERQFLTHSFATRVGFIFPHPINPNLQGGDIDVLAYKENHLFVIQVKNGTYSDGINNATYMEDKRLNEEAAEQVEKSVDFIKHNWTVIAEELEISLSKSEVEIIPLIISNIFEGDLKKYSGYLKLSLFELLIILNNEKSFLLEAKILIQSVNILSPQKSTNKKQNYDLDLWGGKKDFHPSILVKCIKNNSVWDGL